MFINVKVRNTTSRAPEQTYDGDVVTPRIAFENAGIPMGANISLNGAPLSASNLDTPIGRLTTAEDVLLASVVKADGAC